MKTLLKRDVSELSKFWDESYPVGLPGNVKYYGDKKLQVGWASIAIQKFVERVKLNIRGGVNTRNAEPEILRAIETAVKYGNAALIIDRASGFTRVSNPKNSWSEIDSWGQATYYEELPHGNIIVGAENSLWYQSVNQDEEPEDLNSFFVSIFFRANDEHPTGQSRLTPAARNLIREKSRNGMRRAITADQGSYPQVIINGLWEDADPELGASVARIVGGTNRVAGLPADPDGGAKLEITQLDQVSPDPLLRHDSQLARDFASSMNISPTEVGEPSSLTAEAIGALKESLILEVESWEKQIRRDIETFLVELSDVWGEDAPTISFGDPAVISKAAAMDAATKASSIWPQFKYSRAAAAESGLGDATLDEMFDENGKAVTPDEEELLRELGATGDSVLSDF